MHFFSFFFFSKNLSLVACGKAFCACKYIIFPPHNLECTVDLKFLGKGKFERKANLSIYSLYKLGICLIHVNYRSFVMDKYLCFFNSLSLPVLQ